MLFAVQMAYSSITIIRRLSFEMQSHYTPRSKQLFSTREFTKGVNGIVGEECAHKNYFSIPSLKSVIKLYSSLIFHLITHLIWSVC